jgi:hypothetical protein
MVEDLKLKMLSWTPEQANLFHDNISRLGDDCNKIWETVNDGFYVISPHETVFYHSSGKSYHLQFTDLIDQLNLVNSMSDIADHYNLFKITRVNNIQKVSIHGVPFTYWEETVPHVSHGFDFTTLLVNNLDQREVARHFFKNLVIGIDQLIFIGDKLDIPQYPHSIPSINFFYDTTSNNYFWKTNFTLIENKQDSIKALMNEIDTLEVFLQSCLKIVAPNFNAELKNYMREKCTILKPTS